MGGGRGTTDLPAGVRLMSPMGPHWGLRSDLSTHPVWKEVKPGVSRPRRVQARVQPMTGARGGTNIFTGICVIWLAVTAILVTFAWYCWPVMDIAEGTFVPPMVTSANGKGLVSPFAANFPLVDPSGQGRLLHHGFLYSIVVGKLSPRPTYPSIILTMALLDVLALGISSFLFWRVLRSVSQHWFRWHTVLRLFGIRIANTVSGYNFAVYRRIAPGKGYLVSREPTPRSRLAQGRM